MNQKNEADFEAMKKFGKVVQKIKQRKGLIQRFRDRIKGRKEKSFNTEGTKTGRVESGKLEKTDYTDGQNRIFGRIFGKRKGGFFSPERTEKRRAFRVKVSGNRKWIMIGVAVVAVCGTIIYLSVTYGGGGFSFVTKILGAFK